jgi:hypothetical protein
MWISILFFIACGFYVHKAFKEGEKTENYVPTLKALSVGIILFVIGAGFLFA